MCMGLRENADSVTRSPQIAGISRVLAYKKAII